MHGLSSIQEVNSDLFVTVRFKHGGGSGGILSAPQHTRNVPSPELLSYNNNDRVDAYSGGGGGGRSSRNGNGNGTPLSTGKVKRAVSKVFQREFDEFGDRLMSSVRHAQQGPPPGYGHGQQFVPSNNNNSNNGNISSGVSRHSERNERNERDKSAQDREKRKKSR